MLLLPAETFFVTHIWNICSYLCVSFGVYLHSICIYVLSHQYIGHGVLKEKAFRVYFKKSINLSCLSLETSANLVMSRAIYPYLVTQGRCKTQHMGRSKCKRSFHSQDVSQPQIGGSCWKKQKKLCTCKPYNIECHYACIYVFNLFLALCQISACENGSLLWRDEQMRCSRERCTGNVALTFTLCLDSWMQ